ncbi:MAG: molybdenum cofactor biosynthesis protein MoaE [Cytophagales bacterium]|nr:molybdenum cofactor biosynthesis protein MoaE [Cytophagales bacterium]
MIAITDQPIDVDAAIAAAQSERAGAVNVFIGTVRNHAVRRTVVRLEYEAYDKMALKKMEEVAAEARRRWPVEKAAIVHRKGVLQIGEVAVVIAVSTPHRRESFEACQYIIDTIKQVVPIWKKEVYENGETWIAAHP